MMSSLTESSSAVYSYRRLSRFLRSQAINRSESNSHLRSDEVNQNNRLYPSGVLSEGMGNCEGRMKRRAFYSELDHPLPTGNDQVDGVRQTTVSLEKVSHLIRTYEFKNNHLIGESNDYYFGRY